MSSQAEDDAPELPLVHVLISDSFFWDKVDGTLRALEKNPVTPEVPEEGTVFDLVVAEPGVGAVIDLEDERYSTLEFLAALRADERTKEMPVLAYCSHLREDLMDAAREHDADVVPRSTFAANLVRLLMELAGPADAGDPRGE